MKSIQRLMSIIVAMSALLFALPASAHEGTVFHNVLDALAVGGIVVLALVIAYRCLGYRRTR